MELISSLLHFDTQLISFAQHYGLWIYVLLFGIIFGETAFLLLAILPGDSLLFAIGALAARGMLNVYMIVVLLIIAGFLGNILNYWIGKKFGDWLLHQHRSHFINQDHLQRAHNFYAAHGHKTLVIGCFIPIVRTFTGFIAGAAKMPQATFILFTAVGITFWVLTIVSISFWFGSMPIIQEHFAFVIIAITVVSLLPMLFTRKQRSES